MIQTSPPIPASEMIPIPIHKQNMYCAVYTSGGHWFVMYAVITHVKSQPQASRPTGIAGRLWGRCLPVVVGRRVTQTVSHFAWLRFSLR